MVAGAERRRRTRGAAVATGRGRESYAAHRVSRRRRRSLLTPRRRRSARLGAASAARRAGARGAAASRARGAPSTCTARAISAADVLDRHVGAQDARRLRAVDERRGQRVELGPRLACVHDVRAEADERVAQPGVGGHDLGVAAQAVRERLPRVLDLERLRGCSRVVTRNFSATSASISASLVGKWR